MGTKERRLHRARRQASAMLVRVGGELRHARQLAGLSQSEVARMLGLSHTEVGRIERGTAPWASIGILGPFGSVVGLDVSLRTFPGPQPLRDSRHLALLDAFRCLLAPALRLRVEVPVPIAGDQRSWDGVVVGLAVGVGVEVETEVHDAQALERRIGLKQRDSGIERVILVLADTRRNRLAVRSAEGSLRAAFPASGRDVVQALSAACVPLASGIVFLAPTRRPSPSPARTRDVPMRQPVPSRSASAVAVERRAFRSAE